MRSLSVTLTTQYVKNSIKYMVFISQYYIKRLSIYDNYLKFKGAKKLYVPAWFLHK
jgi:hypothetical protein